MPQVKKTASVADQKYKQIFLATPIAIIEQDWRPLVALWQGMQEKYGGDAADQFLTKKSLVKKAFSACKIRECNRASLDLFVAKNKVELKKNFMKCYTKEFGESLLIHLQYLLDDHSYNETSSQMIKFNRFIFSSLMRTSRIAKSRDLSRVVISYQDISERVSLQKFLQKLAQTDGLTELYNHKAIYDRLEEEISRAVRYQLHLSCLMFDCDTFKRINDRYGHVRGDQVLKIIADTIKIMFRRSDVAGRYGGDEFLVILTETPLQGAETAARRFQDVFHKKIREHFSEKEAKDITFSMGVVALKTGKTMTAKEFVTKADRALYQAKREGGNRIKVAKN